ncbi:hypothetical protein [Thermogemmatispora tikiterensis]|uniref:hypothetical protein n=1 Tax=Thermogemmatispora tikiterensis TaxID=1825093 RepID=UPI0011BDB13B|nr:hypothetical protein [Thermogemmatispora tikiterensis]
MRLPTSDAHSAQLRLAQADRAVLPHSSPASSPASAAYPPLALPVTPPPSPPASEPLQSGLGRSSSPILPSGDLTTGGLKTLATRRDLPLRAEWQAPAAAPAPPPAAHVPLFPLLVLCCVLVMLLSGGLLLLLILEP